MRLSVGQRTDVGRTRSENQDSLLVDVPLFLVADGMGGNRGGGTASALAVEVMRSHVPALRDNSDPAAVLSKAVNEAHRRILAEGSARPELSGMGTTLTGAVALTDSRLMFIHVGDSRAYRLRGGVLEQITEDHSYVGELMRMGQLSPEEARVHPHRSLITKALGAGEPDELEPTIIVTDARDGDRFLLCSDGLSSMLDDAEIREVLRDHPNAQDAADALVEAANARNSLDNVTVVVLEVLEGGSPGVQIDVPAVVDRSDDDTSTLVVTPVPSGDEEPEARHEDRPRRTWLRSTLLWVGGVVVVLVGVSAGGRWFLLRNWYIECDQEGSVAVYRGVPYDVLGFSVSRLESKPQPPVPCSSLAGPARDALAKGVTARDRAEADAIVADYRCQASREAVCPPRG